ncbi:MAG: hypothetical protein [Olavius algarvensis Delta 4 endosymbiont]|nr:MAG: hypothetical protein [Olavius algarvensis Delta 4 endosymbiont]
MSLANVEKIPPFLETLGLTEEPLGSYFTDHRPDDGLAPAAMDLPTVEKERRNEIDWQAVFGNFSCALGHIWRARKKNLPACFSAEQFGCPGAAFWLGFNKPQVETIIHYVSTGIPDRMQGEHYCDSPDNLRRILEYIDPPAAAARYCVFKPLSLFAGDERPELVHFFTRPETLGGLHQLAAYVTSDPEVVVSPWSAACGSLVVWPRRYLAEGRLKAVLGGRDTSARKFFKTDELSFTVPMEMFTGMLTRFEGSFLKTKTWSLVRKKIDRSKKAWGEIKDD